MPNRLSHEASPYLRQHADNPVDWYPWGDEALQRARDEDKPILLSVGYSACHWCHVMAHESFEDAATAAVMNAHFVNVKIDREERPDLDQLYQGVVQLMGKGGGWPLTVFLTPDLRPFFGGTYFPPADRYGMPGFPKLLASLAEAWKTQRAECEEQAESFKEGLTQYAAIGLSAAPGTLVTQDVVEAARKLERRVDRTHGGFGARGPKFPNPMNVALLLRGWRRSGDQALESAALLCLEKMAEGGVNDQLFGGFHRYSVDERWAVPHFEKMLYDNAQLLHLYAEAWQVAPRPLWKKTAEDTVAWLAAELTAPQGGLYATQDADSEGEEGKAFVWRPGEVRALLGEEEARLLCAHFGLTEAGNFEHGATVLAVSKRAEALAQELGVPLARVEQRLVAARHALHGARLKRVQPGRDDKILAGWNGLAIRGLAFAGRAFAKPEWVARAVAAADFVLARLDGAVLQRSFQEGAARLTGVLEDYGDLCAGLVALYQATFEPKYLAAAERLADAAVERFWDEPKQAYLAAPKGTADLLVPTYALHDNAFPSGASTLTEAQVALTALTGRARHLEQAGRYLSRVRDELVENPMGFGHLWLAADAFLDGAADVTVVGDDLATAPFLRAVDARYLPTLAVQRLEPSQPIAPVLAEQALARTAGPSGARAYLCRHFACQAPVSAPQALLELLRREELLRPSFREDHRQEP